MITRLPYYFEIPDLSLPFNYKDYFDLEFQRDEAEHRSEGLGLLFPHTADRDDTFLITQDKLFTQHVKQWAQDTLNVKTTSILLIRTKAGMNGTWHCEGPVIRGRRCAINFLVDGDVDHTKTQWGWNPVWGDENILPEQVEMNGDVKYNDVDKINIYETYSNKKINQAFAYNTMMLHRSVNKSCSINRVLVSIAISADMDIYGLHKKYLDGNLLK